MIRQLLAAAIALAAGQTALRPAATTNPIVERGCVIRYDTLNPAGTLVIPRIYEDSAHYCVGVTAVTVNAVGNLVITNTGGPNIVVNVAVDEDETLVARGINCGPSGGGTTVEVWCYDRAGVRVRADDLDMYGPGSNIWFAAHNWQP